MSLGQEASVTAAHRPGETRPVDAPRESRFVGTRCDSQFVVRAAIPIRRYARREPAVTARRNTAEGSARTEAVTSILDAAEALLIAEGQRAVTARRRLFGTSRSEPRPRPLLLRIDGRSDDANLRAVHRAADRPAANDVRSGCAVPPEVAHGDELPGRGSGRRLPEGMDGVAGARLESARDARARRRDDRRVALRGVLTDAFGKAGAEYHLDPDLFPVEALVSLVMTFNQGLLLERLSGISEGHRELLRWIDDWLVDLEAGK